MRCWPKQLPQKWQLLEFGSRNCPWRPRSPSALCAAHPSLPFIAVAISGAGETIFFFNGESWRGHQRGLIVGWRYSFPMFSQGRGVLLDDFFTSFVWFCFSCLSKIIERTTQTDNTMRWLLEVLLASKCFTLPETNIALENQWLEDEIFLLGFGLFSGAILLLVSEGGMCKRMKLNYRDHERTVDHERLKTHQHLSEDLTPHCISDLGLGFIYKYIYT